MKRRGGIWRASQARVMGRVSEQNSVCHATSQVEPGVYRSAFPGKRNFPFLECLGLKSILTLVLEVRIRDAWSAPCSPLPLPLLLPFPVPVPFAFLLRSTFWCFTVLVRTCAEASCTHERRCACHQQSLSCMWQSAAPTCQRLHSCVPRIIQWPIWSSLKPIIFDSFR